MNNKKFSIKENKSLLAIQIFFAIFSLAFIIPFIYVISISVSNEELINKYGYKFIPMAIDFKSYAMVFRNPNTIIDAYLVTAFQALIGTFLSIFFMSLCAYPLSKSNFKLKRIVTIFIFITMIFHGGLIPSFIINTKYFNLRDSIWVYIVPGLASGFLIFIFRTFFKGLPSSLMDSAKIDGASEWRVYFNIILPLSKPVLASFAFMSLIDRWNNWYTSLIYISNTRLYTLQFLLQRILLEIEFIKQLASESYNADMRDMIDSLPGDTFKFAMVVVAAGPMIIIFPFFQKYFRKGMVVGAVKG